MSPPALPALCLQLKGVLLAFWGDYGLRPDDVTFMQASQQRVLLTAVAWLMVCLSAQLAARVLRARRCRLRFPTAACPVRAQQLWR